MNTVAEQQERNPAGGSFIGVPVPERPKRLLWMITPAVVYLAARLFGVLVLAALSAVDGESLGDNLRAWDSQWYMEIAANGYDGVDPGMVDGHGNRSSETPLAFFPGFPLATRLFSIVPGLGTFGAAMAVSLVSGVACAYGLQRLATRHAGCTRAGGLLLIVLFASAPMSIVLSMPYSEALLCALSAWTLVAVLERRWLLAGIGCAMAGLVRPPAAALIAVVALAALVALLRRRDGIRPLPALLLAPTGMLAYLGWVAARTGELDGYFELQQRGWSSGIDGGVTTARFVLETLTQDKSVFETFAGWIVLAAVALLIVCLRQRMPWPLLLFGALILVVGLGTSGLMYAKVRLLLPAFPLLIPLAKGLVRLRRTTAATATALYVCFGAWFGAYALTVWPYAF